MRARACSISLSFFLCTHTFVAAPVFVAVTTSLILPTASSGFTLALVTHVARVTHTNRMNGENKVCTFGEQLRRGLFGLGRAFRLVPARNRVVLRSSQYVRVHQRARHVTKCGRYAIVVFTDWESRAETTRRRRRTATDDDDVATRGHERGLTRRHRLYIYDIAVAAFRCVIMFLLNVSPSRPIYLSLSLSPSFLRSLFLIPIDESLFTVTLACVYVRTRLLN